MFIQERTYVLRHFDGLYVHIEFVFLFPSFLSSAKTESVETANRITVGDLNQLAFAIETVDNDATWASLALDSNNNPHISYINSQGLRYAYHNGSSWTLETVDATGGEECSIELDSNDHPHISYGGLKYAQFNGSSWTIQTVETGAASQSSIDLDSLDNPHISYIQSTALKYAFSNGSSWTIHVIDGGEPYKEVQSQSMALDSHDNPHIVYHYMDRVGMDIMPWRRNDSLRYAYYDSISWNIETVESEGILHEYGGEETRFYRFGFCRQETRYLYHDLEFYPE